MKDRATATCPLCNQSYPQSFLVPGELVRPEVVALIHHDRPEWSTTESICRRDLNGYRARLMASDLEKQKGELSTLDRQVVEDIAKLEVVSKNLDEASTRARTFGERLSDRIASFGGSWTFIIIFASVIFVWVNVNIYLLTKPFDPYPFILLNLVLSCVAAMQAPVIMMSQNRQQVNDRLRAEQDYRVNLKAELEIRALNEMIDHVLLVQSERIVEVQQLQLEILEELNARRGR